MEEGASAASYTKWEYARWRSLGALSKREIPRTSEADCNCGHRMTSFLSLGSVFLAIKHESMILRHASNPVFGFSMMEQVRALCCSGAGSRNKNVCFKIGFKTGFRYHLEFVTCVNYSSVDFSQCRKSKAIFKAKCVASLSGPRSPRTGLALPWTRYRDGPLSENPTLVL